MSDTISVDELAPRFELICKGEIELVSKQVTADTVAVGKDCADDLKRTSPKRDYAEAKHYAPGWKCDVRSGDDGGKQVVVHNVTKPGLTHLLEHGHGGPHPAPAVPHIEAAYQRMCDELDSRLGR